MQNENFCAASFDMDTCSSRWCRNAARTHRESYRRQYPDENLLASVHSLATISKSCLVSAMNSKVCCDEKLLTNVDE